MSGKPNEIIPPTDPFLLRLQPGRWGPSVPQKNLDPQIMIIFELAYREIERRYSKKPITKNSTEEQKATITMMRDLKYHLIWLLSTGSKRYSEADQLKIREKWVRVVELIGRFNYTW